jgi:hypothetical protein
VRENLHAIEANPMIRARMEGQLAERRPDLSAEEVEAHVRDNLREAIELLDGVEPQAEAVDRRAADFARRSFARFRYLQEVSSGRRTEVRTMFEEINERYAGERLGDLPEALELPDLRVPSVGLLGGLDSLAVPQGARRSGIRRPLEEDDFDLGYDAAVDEMALNINSSLTVLRANRFVRGLGVGPAGLSSAELVPGVQEWLLELAGLLLHAETTDSDYRVASRREFDEEPPRDLVGDHRIDRFHLSMKADV